MANNGQLIVQNDIFYPNTSSSNVIDLDEVMSNKYLKEVAFTTRQKSTGYKINDKVNFKMVHLMYICYVSKLVQLLIRIY